MDLTEEQRMVLATALDLYDRGQPINADTIAHDLGLSGMDVAGIVSDIEDEQLGADESGHQVSDEGVVRPLP